MRRRLKKFLQSYETIWALAWNTLLSRRVAGAATLLKKANLYPDILPALLDDYRYSVSVTYRSVLQVINIEEVIQYIANARIPGAFVECGTYTGGGQRLCASLHLAKRTPPATAALLGL